MYNDCVPCASILDVKLFVEWTNTFVIRYRTLDFRCTSMLDIGHLLVQWILDTGHYCRFVQWMYTLYIDIGHWTFTWVCTVNVYLTSILDFGHSHRFVQWMYTLYINIGHWTLDIILGFVQWLCILNIDIGHWIFTRVCTLNVYLASILDTGYLRGCVQ